LSRKLKRKEKPIIANPKARIGEEAKKKGDEAQTITNESMEKQVYRS
jgi:hypothetical protein